eukprot:TRINITY_DN36364_c0_g1_i2.p1 TRINITY_DN36364_c0_g1~~TRINITY_DN36364_c0_g1_i2.p1  ORF type:complete len:325 (-),score=36.01 TRINITY_DN36364_c0_g1_i2:270-1244(-)
MCIRDRYQRRVRGREMGEMGLTVQWGERRMRFTMDPARSVQYLMDHIQDKEGLPPEFQHLFWVQDVRPESYRHRAKVTGTFLDCGRTLDDYGMADGALVRLIMRPFVNLELSHERGEVLLLLRQLPFPNAAITFKNPIAQLAAEELFLRVVLHSAYCGMSDRMWLHAQYEQLMDDPEIPSDADPHPRSPTRRRVRAQNGPLSKVFPHLGLSDRNGDLGNPEQRGRTLWSRYLEDVDYNFALKQAAWVIRSSGAHECGVVWAIVRMSLLCARGRAEPEQEGRTASRILQVATLPAPLMRMVVDFVCVWPFLKGSEVDSKDPMFRP